MKKHSHFPKPNVLLVGLLVVHFPSLTLLLSVFARALPLYRSLQVSFILRINFYDVYSKASSFPISWFSHVLGHCHGWFLHVLGHCPGQRSCVSFAYVTLCHRAQAGRAKPTIKDRPKDQSDQSGYPTDQLEIWDRPAESSEKKLDAASRFESFFSLSLEGERSAGETAHRCTHTGASVFARRQKFCDSAARLDGLAKLSSRSNGLEGQIEPEIKRCGPTRVRNWCINASVTCDPRQNKIPFEKPADICVFNVFVTFRLLLGSSRLGPGSLTSTRLEETSNSQNIMKKMKSVCQKVYWVYPKVVRVCCTGKPCLHTTRSLPTHSSPLTPTRCQIA